MVNAESAETSSALQWEISPAERGIDPKKVKIAIGIAIASAPIGFLLTQSLVLSVLAPVILLVSLSEYWRSKKYSLTHSSATAGSSEMKWSEVKSVHVDGNLILLSPFAKESRLNAVRGVKLQFSIHQRDEILNWIRNHVGANVRFLGE